MDAAEENEQDPSLASTEGADGAKATDSSYSQAAALHSHSRSISLPNPLSLIPGHESRDGLSYSNNDLESTRMPHFLDNLLAIGQAAVDAVEAANANMSRQPAEDSDTEDPAPPTLTEEEQTPNNLQSIQELESSPNDNCNPMAGMSVDPEQSSHGVSEGREDADNYSLMCPVCLEAYYHPFRCTPCRHIFCEPCLKRMRKADMNSPTKCPLCREVIKKCFKCSALGTKVTNTLPEAYQLRHRMERKQRHKLPPLPGVPIVVDNRNLLATWSAVCGVVLLMMLVFTLFACFVGFVLWYTVEVVLDIVGELFMNLSDFFSFSWQALIILYIDGKIPNEISEVLSGSAGRIIGTLSRLVNRTKTFFLEGEVPPPPPMPVYLSYEHIQLNNTSHLLTKVTQGNMANYVFLAGLFTYLLYKLARYFQNGNLQAPNFL